MPKIIHHNGLTGQVGPVVFVGGEGQTDDPKMLAYFAERSDEYEVQSEDGQPAEPPAPELNEEGYTGLSDEQVAEAYATTCPEGDAESRHDQVLELRAVAAYAHTFDAKPAPAPKPRTPRQPKGA